MIDIPANFVGFAKCWCGEDEDMEDEDMEQIFYWDKLNEKEEENIKYEKIYSGNFKEQAIMIQK